MTPIDFASMQIGDKAPLPSTNWDDENRVYFNQAMDYCASVDGQKLFEVRDSLINGSSKTRNYWIERIR